MAVQRSILQGHGARPNRVQQRPVVGDEQHRARELPQRALERLAALQVEMVRRLIEHEHVGSRADEDRQRQPAALAARELAQRLLGLLAGEQEPPQERPRLVGRQSRGALRGLQWRAGAAGRELVGVLAQVAELDVVPCAQLARLELPATGERLDQRRLAGAVGAHQRYMLATL